MRDQFRTAVAFVCLLACFIAFLLIFRFSLFLLLLLISLCFFVSLFYNFMHFYRYIYTPILCMYVCVCVYVCVRVQFGLHSGYSYDFLLFNTKWNCTTKLYFCYANTIRLTWEIYNNTNIHHISLSTMLNASNRICVVLNCVHTLSSSRKWNTNEHKTL